MLHANLHIVNGEVKHAAQKSFPVLVCMVDIPVEILL